MLTYRVKFLPKAILVAVMTFLPAIILASGVDYKYGISARDIKLAPTINSKPVFDTQEISYIPRIYLSGYAGTGIMGQGDMIAPMRLTEDKIFAIYGQGRYAPASKEFWEYKTWTGSAGFLYRQIVPHIERVLGIYVLGDYSQARDGHKYWVIGPGIESLGHAWDFRLNGYIPIGKKSWKDDGWAQKFGNYSYVQSVDNNVYDHKLAYYQEVGMGGDVEIGRKLFKSDNMLIKGYAQGYYYNMNYNSDVIGGGVKLALQPNKFITFSANYTYDNYRHNTFMLGTQVRLNDLFSSSSKPNKRIDTENLSNRLFDLVDRSYGNIGSGITAAVTKGCPRDMGQELYSSSTVFIGPVQPEIPNVPNLPIKKGTYENPYTEDDVAERGLQAILDEIHANSTGKVDIYFTPGAYSSLEGPIVLYAGMSIISKGK